MKWIEEIFHSLTSFSGKLGQIGQWIEYAKLVQTK